MNGDIVKASRSGKTHWSRGAHWTVALAATVLLLMSVGSYWWHREQLADLAAGHLRLVVAGPARLHRGVANRYTVTTAGVTGDPMPSRIELVVYTPAGEPILEHRDETDRDGHLLISIPADLDIPSGAKLEVLAVHDNKFQRADTRLAIDPVRYVTRLSLDKPLYQSGETIYLRSLTLSRFGLEADHQAPVRFEILGPGGATVAGSVLEGVTERGVGNAALRLPEGLADGKYTLVARSPDNLFPEQKRTFLVRRHMPPPAKPGVMSDDTETKVTGTKIIVRFYPEGGELVAGLENRVYFTARDPPGEPVSLMGKVVDGEGKPVAGARTTYQGMGLLNFKPRDGETYCLQIASPNVTDKPKLPSVVANHDVVLTTGLGIFEAGEPLEFNVRLAKADMPLVASAWCRGVQVGQQPFTTQAGANSVSIPLADEVCGVIRLTVYDYTVYDHAANPPKPLAERLVYRRPARRLNVEVVGCSEAYTPGASVDLSLRVTDEHGEPVPRAVLGVAVVDEAVLNRTDVEMPRMPSYFLLTTEVEDPEDLEDANFYLLDDPNNSKTAEATLALDMLLGTQGWRRFVHPGAAACDSAGFRDRAGFRDCDDEQIARLVALDGQSSPPAMFDNLGKILATYEQSLAGYRQDRTRTLSTLTTVSFFGGMGLVLLVAMLRLLGVARGPWLWTLALGTAAACLIVGVILMNPDRLRSGPRDAVEFTPFSTFDQPVSPKVATPGPGDDGEKSGKIKERRFVVRQYAHEHIPGKPGTRSDFTKTLYWDPLLVTDDEGRAKLRRFDLSDSVTTFRVLIDAHAPSGRLGSGTKTFISRELHENEVGATAAPKGR
jgi:hypothetical protein